MTLATPHQNHSLCIWNLINITFWCLTLITVHLVSINHMQDLHAMTQSTPFLYLDRWYWHRTKWQTTKLKSTRGANLLKKNLPSRFTIEQTFTWVLLTLRAWLVPWFLLTVLFTEKENVRKSLNGNVFKFINLDNSTCFRVCILAFEIPLSMAIGWTKSSMLRNYSWILQIQRTYCIHHPRSAWLTETRGGTRAVPTLINNC